MYCLFCDVPCILDLKLYLLAYEDGTECSVPKLRHIKFRRRGITQKKTYNVLCIVFVYVCTELLPPGGYPISVKYIMPYVTLLHMIILVMFDEEYKHTGACEL
jgi:hypothetical protein